MFLQELQGGREILKPLVNVLPLLNLFFQAGLFLSCLSCSIGVFPEVFLPDL